MNAKHGEILPLIARATISQALNVPYSAPEYEEWLSEFGASFVTLTQHGQLRGCIGTLEAHRPLGDDVKSNALSAAFRDPRFEPMRTEELAITRVEVSVLSPPRKMSFRDEADALDQLQPGIDGVIFKFKHHSSTFLPQVWEQLPNPQDFMVHLKHKAGLPPQFWDDGIELFRYTVEKWKE